MANDKGSVSLVFIVILFLFYFYILSISLRGCGYAGYRHGYSTRPSIFFGGGNYFYPGQSIRGGSIGGPSHIGGGPHGGK